MGDLSYIKIDDDGLHIQHEDEIMVLPADTIISCAGQEPRDELVNNLGTLGADVFHIGGVKEVKELDAAQAIRDGVKLAYKLSQSV